MTELATAKNASGSVGILSPSPRRPSIDTKQLAKIIGLLYDAYSKRTGAFAHMSIETHAPQHKYYPGSPRSKKSVVEEINPFMQALDESLYEMEIPPQQSESLRKAFEKQVPFIHQEKESKVVPRKSLAGRRWLWFATLTDRRELSDRVYEAHCRIFEDHPEFYDERVVDMDVEGFREKIRKKSYKIGSPYQSAEYWLRCGKTLFEEFGGDPVVLLQSAGWSVAGVYKWKKDETRKRGYDPIPGWGRKLISLYFLYLAELGYKMPKDVFPADVHAQALVLQTGALHFGDKDVVYTSALAEMIRKEVTDICKKKKYDVILFGHASWLTGSQLCVNCSGNPAMPLLCPVYNECKGRVDTSSYFAKGIWRKDGQVMTKGGERPEYGNPSDFAPRERTRKGRQVKAVPSMMLFPK